MAAEWNMLSRDAATIRKAAQIWPKRWRGLTTEFKDGIVAGLGEANTAMRKALAAAKTIDQSSKAAAVLASVAKTAAVIEGQVQTDDWNAEKNQRLDEGKATERMSLGPVYLEEPCLPPPPQLPPAE